MELSISKAFNFMKAIMREPYSLLLPFLYNLFPKK